MTADPLKIPMKIGPHTVPGLWRYMLPHELTLLKIPPERRSTCQNCPRVASDDYRPDYRCCTYHPRVPNFLLGLALEDRTSAKVLEQIREAGWLLPEGFQAAPSQWAVFLQDVAENQFGKSQSILCPFLDRSNGFCNIYAFRNSVCSTFFCHADHGSIGQRFWDSLQTCVLQVEMALGQWALNQVGFDVAAYIARLNQLAAKVSKLSQKNGCWTEAVRRHLWGRHFGSELEIYRACAEVISQHRDELWHIANTNDILEATAYEKSTHSLVSEKYQDQIEDDYSDDDQSTAPPANLWKDVLRHYRGLWRLPSDEVRLSERAKLRLNPLDDKEAQHHAEKSHEISLRLRKNSSVLAMREFISADTAAALEYFRQPAFITHKTISDLQHILADKAEDFIAEWSAKKVLISES